MRTINQGQRILSEFLVEIYRLADLCNFEYDEDKNKIIRKSIIAGISSTKAYQQCISKGSSLPLEECIKYVTWNIQQEDKFKHYATQSYRTLHKFTKLVIKATEVDHVPEEEAATEEAEDIAQALKRIYAETVETHGILGIEQNAKQMDKSATSTTD